VRLNRATVAAALAALFVGAVYIGLLAWLPRDSLWSGDQGAKLVQVVSLIRAKLTSLAIPDPSLAYDPSGRFSPLPALFTRSRDDVAYSIFSYPYAALTAPFFFFLGYNGLFVIPLVATVGTLGLSAALGARLGLRPLWAIPPILGLATPLGFYALVFWEHALATMLATAALLVAAQGLPRLEQATSDDQRAPNALRWLLCGLLAGLAWWFRAEALLLGPALLVGLAWAGAGQRPLAWTAAGIALALAPLALFHLLVYGTPLGGQVATNYGAPGAVTRLISARLTIVGELLVGLNRLRAFWFAAWACAIAALLSPARLRPWAVAGLALCAASGLLMTPLRYLWNGLANAATFTLLAPLSLRPGTAPATRLLGGTSGAYIAAALAIAPNDGGAQWGPRYLLLVLPALSLLALLAARELTAAYAPARRLAALALAALLVTGVGVQFRGLDLLNDSYTRSQRIVRVVNARPARLVVTDAEFGPQLLGPLYFERPILFVDASEPWPELIALLRDHGEGTFALLTDRPHQQEPEALQPLGVSCELVEGLPFGLSLFDCALGPTPSPQS